MGGDRLNSFGVRDKMFWKR